MKNYEDYGFEESDIQEMKNVRGHLEELVQQEIEFWIDSKTDDTQEDDKQIVEQFWKERGLQKPFF